jgi:hypothetical protein
MAAKDARAPTEPSDPMPNPTDMARKQMDAMADVQKEFLKNLEQANQLWAARVKAETELAGEYVSKLSAARSLPETTTIFQEWATRRMALFAEDSQRFMADMEKFMSATSRLMPKSFTGGGSS